MSEGLDRYRRQMTLPAIGLDGQRRLASSHVLVAGCGALGSVIVEQLARAGVGTLTVVDRDIVDFSNLHRQSLFDEEDARRATPKVEAAKARLARIASAVQIRAFYDDLGARTAQRYGEGVDVIVDGLDNLESRYLLNDLAVARGTPYIYGAAVGTEGMVAVIRPGVTPCLRCLAPQPPPAGSVATCETVGVLGSVTALIGSLEVVEAIKILVGAADASAPGLLAIDAWSNRWRRIDTATARDPDCPCCGQRQFSFLNGVGLSAATKLCGRNSVQWLPAEPQVIELAQFAAQWASLGPVERAGDRVGLRVDSEAIEITLFLDGRIVIRGTEDLERARTLIARFVGM